MMHASALQRVGVIALVTALGGCGGGGGSGSGSSPAPVNSSVQSITPSLGQFDENTHVVLYSDLNETTRLGDGFVKNGSVSINIGNYKGPYVAVIDGTDPFNTGVGFYDEASHQRQLLGARQLRALNPDSTQHQGIGVTVLTELAVKYYKTHYGTALAANNINIANAVVQAAIRSAPPLLTPPTLVGEGTAPNSLDWNGSSQEKYALILAALAQAENSSSSGSKTAANLIDDLGTDSDLAADKVNLPADLSQPLQTVAATYANTATQLQMATATFATANNTGSSTSGGGLVTVSLQPANVAVTTDTDVGLAKQLFSDLRTAKLAVNNNSATAPGFYQTVGQNIVHDTHTSIRNHGAHLIDATFAMEQGTELLHNVATGNTSQYGAPTSRYDASTGTYIPSYVEDNHRSYCYVDVPAGITAASMTAVCQYHWGDGTYDSSTNTTTYPIDQVTVSQVTSGYTYSAVASTISYSPIVNGLVSPAGTAVTGSLILSVDASGQVTGFSINGNLPLAPSVSPGDSAQLNISATKTSPATGQFTYTLSGTYQYVSGGATVVTLTADGTQFNTQLVGTPAVELVSSGAIKGVLKTAAYEYDGTFTLKDLQSDKSNTVTGITYISFMGDIKDNAQPASASPLFSGSVIEQVTNFSSFDATQPVSSSNYMHQAASLGGTLNMPSQPAMTVTLGLAYMDWNKVHLSLDYTFGTSHLFGVTDLAGMGGAGVAATDQIMTINSVNGVKLILTRAASTGTISGQVLINTFNPQVASITGNWINYRDGSSETLY
jgi:hypothetical protein